VTVDRHLEPSVRRRPAADRGAARGDVDLEAGVRQGGRGCFRKRRLRLAGRVAEGLEDDLVFRALKAAVLADARPGMDQRGPGILGALDRNAVN
jgi:hypothetical protein